MKVEDGAGVEIKSFGSTTLAETAIVDYPLSFADKRKRYRLPYTVGKCVCLCVYIYIYIYIYSIYTNAPHSVVDPK